MRPLCGPRSAAKAIWRLGLRNWASAAMASVGQTVTLRSNHVVRSPFAIRGTDADRSVLYQVLVERQYEDAMIAGRDIRLIVDCGAHVGLASLYFANRFPAARIIAVEPDTANLDLLRQNCRAYEQIEVMHGALWPVAAQLRIANPSAASWAFMIEPGSGSVPAITIQEIVAKYGVIDVLKMDVEGTEKRLFDAPESKEWLGDLGCLMVELHDRFVPGCTRSLLAWAEGRRFDLRRCGETSVVDFGGAR